MGVIARDNNGKFIMENCKELQFMADAFMAEAYAIREGLDMA
jgi:hypothetical protein